jgi:ABC-2 type transport system permease protein
MSSARLAPYLEFARKAFAREATYRVDVFTEIGSLVLRVYLLRSLWTALYAQNAAPADLPLHAMITYATVALLMSLIFEVDGTRQIRDKVREGTIAIDLMRPLNVPLSFFSDGFGRTVFHAFVVVPSLLCALLLVHVDVPPLPRLALFGFALVQGYIVNSLLNFLMNSVAFWTLETFAIQLMVRWVSDLLSGQIIPLSFFAGIAGTLVGVLPFAAIYSTPLRIYIGQIAPDAIPGALLSQTMWMVLFALLAAVVWRAAARRVVVQGG